MGLARVWLKWVRWRWEFMRRDPEYRNAYNKALGYRKQAGFSLGPVVQGPDSVAYTKTPQGKKETRLCKDFDLPGVMIF